MSVVAALAGALVGRHRGIRAQQHDLRVPNEPAVPRMPSYLRGCMGPGWTFKPLKAVWATQSLRGKPDDGGKPPARVRR